MTQPQPSLFDPASIVPAVCPACGATKQPQADRAPACTHDHDQRSEPGIRRPRGCLNAYNPATTEIPY